VTDVSEVVFLQLILFANTTGFLFSARISLSFFEKTTAVRKFARDGVASKRLLTRFLACFKKW